MNNFLGIRQRKNMDQMAEEQNIRGKMCRDGLVYGHSNTTHDTDVWYEAHAPIWGEILQKVYDLRG